MQRFLFKRLANVCVLKSALHPMYYKVALAPECESVLFIDFPEKDYCYSYKATQSTSVTMPGVPLMFLRRQRAIGMVFRKANAS